ncbi:hypothetical protein Dimus_008989 [Dionaea muscipula]
MIDLANGPGKVYLASYATTELINPCSPPWASTITPLVADVLCHLLWDNIEMSHASTKSWHTLLIIQQEVILDHHRGNGHTILVIVQPTKRIRYNTESDTFNVRHPTKPWTTVHI